MHRCLYSDSSLLSFHPGLYWESAVVASFDFVVLWVGVWVLPGVALHEFHGESSITKILGAESNACFLIHDQYWLACWFVGLLPDCLLGCLAGWLVGWFADDMIKKWEQECSGQCNTTGGRWTAERWKLEGCKIGNQVKCKMLSEKNSLLGLLSIVNSLSS